MAILIYFNISQNAKLLHIILSILHTQNTLCLTKMHHNEWHHLEIPGPKNMVYFKQYCTGRVEFRGEVVNSPPKHRRKPFSLTPGPESTTTCRRKVASRAAILHTSAQRLAQHTWNGGMVRTRQEKLCPPKKSSIIRNNKNHHNHLFPTVCNGLFPCQPHALAPRCTSPFAD